jgi:hypothetical protein
MTDNGNNNSSNQQYVGSKNRKGPINAGPNAKQRNAMMGQKANMAADEKQRKREARKQGRRDMRLATVDFRLAEIL